MRFFRQYRYALLVTLVAFVILSAVIVRRLQTYDPFQGEAIADPPFTSLTYGIQTFLWWDTTAASVHVEWVRLMVFSHVKQIFAWKDIEKRRGEWDFFRADQIVDEIEQKGLKLVIRLSETPEWAFSNLNTETDDFVDTPPEDYADFAAYCGTVAARYKGRIVAYQIWNEPNLAREWGGRAPNAAEYSALLEACSRAIRAADPNAILISAGLAPTGNYDVTAQPDDVYLQAMYDTGFQEYIDVVGMHAPGYTSPELSLEDADKQGIARWATFRRPEDLRRIMVANGDAARQAAILEFGWTIDPRPDSDYHWFAVSQEEQAQYFVEAYQYAAEHWRPWIGLMSAIYIASPSWTANDEEYWWAVTTSEGDTRPAYVSLANMAKYCGERIIPERAPDSPEALGLVNVDPCT